MSTSPVSTFWSSVVLLYLKIGQWILYSMGYPCLALRNYRVCLHRKHSTQSTVRPLADVWSRVTLDLELARTATNKSVEHYFAVASTKPKVKRQEKCSRSDVIAKTPKQAINTRDFCLTWSENSPTIIAFCSKFFPKIRDQKALRRM